MNIDKNILSSFAALDDEALLSAIKMIAASSGVDIGSTDFDPAQLNALRSAMRGATDEDIAMVKNLFDGFKGNK